MEIKEFIIENNNISNGVYTPFEYILSKKGPVHQIAGYKGIKVNDDWILSDIRKEILAGKMVHIYRFESRSE